MNIPVFYCKHWSLHYKQAVDIWPEKKARTAHERGKPYTVLIQSAERPSCVLSVGKDFVFTRFLDAHLRDWCYYGFSEVEPGLLFIGQAVTREYVGDSAEVSRGELYRFGRAGDMLVRRQSYNPDKAYEDHSVVDVSSNYSKMPDFGEYEDLIRFQRDIAVKHSF
jgi:hypothetical protein